MRWKVGYLFSVFLFTVFLYAVYQLRQRLTVITELPPEVSQEQN